MIIIERIICGGGSNTRQTHHHRHYQHYHHHANHYKYNNHSHNLMFRTLMMMFLLAILASIFTDARIRKSRRNSASLGLHRVARKREIKFSCVGRPVGYYADPDFNCHVFHICDNFGRRIPMRCPAQTMFNQMYRVCDWEYNVDCASSPEWYHVNSNMFERESSSSTGRIDP